MRSVVLGMCLLAGTTSVFAGDLQVAIPIPQRSIATPSQKLNREGVDELKHGHRKKAKRLFYRAYLLDPNDPFTLNNLGYMAELEGDADRALRFYALAGREHTDAIIDKSSEADLKGRPLDEAFRQLHDFDQETGNAEANADANNVKLGKIELGKINERAIVLLQQGHVFEARNMLQSALPRHPNDPFLLNNLGYALEATGDVDGALRCYSQAASLYSTERVVVTPRAKWRGRPVSEVAKENAVTLTKQIARGEGVEATTARLNLRGVAALNDNNPSAAKEFFLQAYKEDAQNSFTLNNLGYISELGGDRETAEMYYEAARSGRDAKSRVSYSTRRDVEGQKIDTLANENQSDVEATLRAVQEEKRRQQKPIELKRRDGLPVSSDQDATPVPPVGVQAPALPTLPPPNSDQQ